MTSLEFKKSMKIDQEQKIVFYTPTDREKASFQCSVRLYDVNYGKLNAVISKWDTDRVNEFLIQAQAAVVEQMKQDNDIHTDFKWIYPECTEYGMDVKLNLKSLSYRSLANSNKNGFVDVVISLKLVYADYVKKQCGFTFELERIVTLVPAPMPVNYSVSFQMPSLPSVSFSK